MRDEPTFRIELASGPAAVEEVRALFLEYADGLGVDLCFQGFQKELDALPGAYAPPRGRLLVARTPAETAGCVALRPFDAEGACEMKRLYVRPRYRGTGLGRSLAERIVAEARACGYARMLLDTLPSMDRARALYRSLGFVETDPHAPSPLPGVLYMRLDLDSTPDRRRVEEDSSTSA
jgi:ribosomal protein S18 acetylase RimI-like enzyme